MSKTTAFYGRIFKIAVFKTSKVFEACFEEKKSETVLMLKLEYELIAFKLIEDKQSIL